MTMPHRPTRRFAVAMAAALLLATAGDGGASPTQTSPQGLADRAAEQFVRGFGDYVARRMHYPPSDSPEERAKNIDRAAGTLNGLIEEAGDGPPPRSVGGRVSGLYFQILGGDVESLDGLQIHRSWSFIYWTRFSKFGPALIKLTVGHVQENDPLEILMVGVGLSERSPDAAARVASLMEKVFIREHGAITPGMRRLLNEFLQLALPKEPEDARL
jgi:hypothetical protein